MVSLIGRILHTQFPWTLYLLNSTSYFRSNQKLDGINYGKAISVSNGYMNMTLYKNSTNGTPMARIIWKNSSKQHGCTTVHCSVWKTHNQHQHSIDASTHNIQTWTCLTLQVQGMYNTVPRLDSQARTPFNTPIQTVLNLSALKLESWVTIQQTFVKQALQRTNHREAVEMPSITDLFSPISITKPPISSKTNKAYSFRLSFPTPRQKPKDPSPVTKENPHS